MTSALTPPTALRTPRGAAALLALCAATLLSACAGFMPPFGPVGAQPLTVTNPYAAPTIAPPATSVGVWHDLGHVRAPWFAGDAAVPVNGVNAPTRIVGLRRDDGRWLAIIIAQVAPVGNAPCPAPTSLHVPNTGPDGCLRMRRDADFDGWLSRQHSVLHRWLEDYGLSSLPRAWIAMRLPAVGGGALETHALVDPTLIEPASRNGADFLAGAEPGQRWAREFASATRAAGRGLLAVPPFPFAPLVAPPVPVVVVPAAAAAPAAPMPARPLPPQPRRDRE